MEVLRKIFHVIFIGLLSLATATAIFLATLSLVVTDRQTIKSWPEDSGVYNRISRQILKLTEKPDSGGDETLDDSLAKSPLDRDQLAAVIESVYEPAYWQSKYDTVVDGFYDWLEGTDPALNFTVKFNDRNQQLADALETELAAQLADYPQCPAGVSQSEFDPLSASCLPAGVTARQAARSFSNEIRGQDSFLADAEFSQDNVNLDPTVRQNAPNVFAVLKSLPYFLTVAVLLLVLAVIFTDKSRLHGLRKAGRNLFGVGFTAWLSFFLVKKLVTSLPLPDNEAEVDQDIMNEIARPLGQAVLDDFTTAGLWVALFVVMAGALFWLAAYIWHKAYHHNEAEAIAKRAMAQKPPADKDSRLPPPVKP